MSVYNYDNIKYHINGMSVINTDKQQGILVYLRREHDNMEMSIFLDKRDCAHFAEMTKRGREYWKRFRLPRMKKQNEKVKYKVADLSGMLSGK